MATGNNEDDDIAWISQVDDVSILFDYSPSPPPQFFDCDDLLDTLPPSSKRSKCAIEDATKEPLKETTNRFATPKTSPERRKAAEGVVPSNTKSSTRWAENTFNLWVESRRGSEEPVPEGLLQCHDPAVVCKWMCLFVLEARRADSKPYPPSTLRNILSGLNRILQSNKAPFSILNKKDPLFRDLMKTLDTVSSDLHRQGIGATKNSAPVITIEHENMFWAKQLLGYHSPKVLQHTVFFYVGLHFVLRGIQEQYNLIPSQFKRFPPASDVYNGSVYYEYTEFISKNNQHRFKDVDSSNKCVRVYAQPESEKCIVKLLDEYLALLPGHAMVFYVRPLNEFPRDPTKSCFINSRVGVNTLKSIIPGIARNSGCGVLYTNHSLRATAITRMFNSGVPEKVIAENSGHRSTKALRCYERTSIEQQRAVSRVITDPLKPFEIVEVSPGPTKTVVNHDTLPGISGQFSNCTFHITK